jgi:coenzyme F420-0:L-glutamate ligase/coenzyme F420-1:gamma-L-glutamate ligase
MASLRRAKHAALFPVRLPVVKPKQDLARIISGALRKRKLGLLDGDILAVASKVVSTTENRMIRLDTIHASRKARRLAMRCNIDKRLAHVVLNEADQVLSGVNGFLLTIKDGILTANAGVDLKNSQPETASLWPRDPNESARKLRRALEKKYGSSIGVEIVDSRVTPMRLGTIGLAIGYSGVLPVKDERGRVDLYGRRVEVTQTNLVDDIAGAAHLLMGEVDDRIGAVLLRGLSVPLSDSYDSPRASIAPNKCLIAHNLKTIRR